MQDSSASEPGSALEVLQPQFHELLRTACREGPSRSLRLQFERLARLCATQQDPLSEILKAVNAAAGQVARELDLTVTNAEARLQMERRLRQSSTELVATISCVVAQASAALITTLGALDQRLTETVEQLTALQTVNSAANSSLDLGTMLDLTARAVRSVTRSDLCSIYVFDDQRNDLVLRASTGLSPHVIGKARMSIGEGITGWAAQTGKPVAVADAWADPRFKYIPESGEESYRSMLSVPIVVFTVHKLVGVLNVQTVQVRDWTTAETAFLESVSGQIALAIENARLYRETDEQLRRKVEQMTTLQRVSALVASSLDVQEVLDLIVTYLKDLGRADKCSVFVLDDQIGAYRIASSKGLSEGYRERVRVPVGQGVVGAALRTKEPVIVFDALSDPRIAASEEDVRAEGYRSLLALPLLTKRTEIGVACLYAYEPHGFQQAELPLLLAFCDEAALALDNAQLYQEVRWGLQTKSLLLAEMHHRVKNNLQTIAALLSMQMRRAKVASERIALAESIARIQSIASIHDLLSHEDIGLASVRDIVQQVVGSVTSALTSTGVTVHYDIEDHTLQIASKEATILALVLNEVVTNAIQHGFAQRETGTLRVAVRRHLNEVSVEVLDDGSGLPSGFSVDGSGGLGTQIIHTLVSKDLHGSFTLIPSPGGGTLAVIRFPAVITSEPNRLAPQVH
ncbi:MAG: GAF domain-containing protein [Chloroflexi bacterium]|nr:GAF domain-containing protein [Chloroflexota bacterium]